MKWDKRRTNYQEEKMKKEKLGQRKCDDIKGKIAN